MVIEGVMHVYMSAFLKRFIRNMYRIETKKSVFAFIHVLKACKDILSTSSEVQEAML